MLVHHRRPPHEARLRRRLLQAVADQRSERPAAHLQLHVAGSHRRLQRSRWRAATPACSFPNDPNNFAKRPVPNTVDFNTGVGTLDDHVMYNAFYAQDQWTLKRLTASGALRFDHATSGYGETCIGPNPLVPVQTTGQRELLHARGRRRQLQGPDAALRRDVGSVRHRPDGPEVQRRQVPQCGRHHRRLFGWRTRAVAACSICAATGPTPTAIGSSIAT